MLVSNVIFIRPTQTSDLILVLVIIFWHGQIKISSTCPKTHASSIYSDTGENVHASTELAIF